MHDTLVKQFFAFCKVLRFLTAAQTDKLEQHLFTLLPYLDFNMALIA